MARDHRPREAYTEFGIVLKNSPVGESDAILTLLLERRGKLSALAKGIKRSKKRFMGGLDLFDSAVFALEERGSDDHLPLLTGVSERRSLNANSLQAFAAASVALEVTNHLALERDPEAGLYVAPLSECLRTLDSEAALEKLVRFLTVLLSQTGFSDFENTSHAHPEVKAWLQSVGAPPSRAVLSSLLGNLLHSIEAILGRQLATRRTAERFLLTGNTQR